MVVTHSNSNQPTVNVGLVKLIDHFEKTKDVKVDHINDAWDAVYYETVNVEDNNHNNGIKRVYNKFDGAL